MAAPTICVSNRTLENLLEKLGESSPLENAIESLCKSRFNAIFFLKIRACNGYTGFGVPFSRVFCDTETLCEEFYPFASIFSRGIEMLYNCLKKSNYIYSLDDVSKILLVRLLSFLTETDSMKFIEELERKSCGPLYDKPQFTVAIAEHVFSKLTLTRSYTVDKTCTEQDFVSGTCKCGCNTDIKHKFEDTSAGCSAVWHGSLDAIVGHAGDRVPLLISGNREVDKEYKYLTVDKHLNYHMIKHQLIAQAVVLSFLKQKNYPDSKISLSPVIGVSAKEVIFFLYDCKEDVLLQSVKMSLRCGKAVRYETVIAIWLALNYNYLGSGLGNIRNVHKCNFSSRAGDILDVYRSELIFGGVTESYEEDTLYPDDIPKEKICWPNKKPKFDF